jgi:hypothetical protein
VAVEQAGRENVLGESRGDYEQCTETARPVYRAVAVRAYGDEENGIVAERIAKAGGNERRVCRDDEVAAKGQEQGASRIAGSERRTDTEPTACGVFYRLGGCNGRTMGKARCECVSGSIGEGIGGSDGNDGNLEPAAPAAPAAPVAPDIANMAFVHLVGLLMVCTVVCLVMSVWEVVSEIQRLYQGKGTLWRDIRK